MARELIEIVDAAYGAAGSDQDWVDQVATAAYSALDQGLGISVGTCDASSGDTVRTGVYTQIGCPPGFQGSRLAQTIPGEHVPSLFGFAPPVVLLSECVETFEFDRFIGPALRPFDIRDIIGIRCIEPSGRGCVIAASLPERRPLPARRRSLLARVAAHVVAGWRLRQKLAGEAESSGVGDYGDAIFDQSGRIVHLADGIDARRDGVKLRAGVERLRASKQARRLDPDTALELWRALVDGRWSIVQRTDSDGKRFLLARRNAPEVRDIGSLAPREALAAAYAALGHSSKLIAYELGIAESSLSVLLKQAMHKLGAKNRMELALLFGA
jgi:DNA-binding CsgD family transcriptional regulator